MGQYQPKQLVGYTTCPECGYADAELKGDKNGDLYRWCPQEDCAVQSFTRGKPARTRRMLAAMRPAAPAAAPAPAADPVKPADPAPAVDTPPAPAKRKPAKFFSTLMDAD